MAFPALLAYYALLILLSAHGLHRAWLCLRLLRKPRAVEGPSLVPDAELPIVTVQLPIYNEMYVAGRLLDAVAAFDWPRERLEIQVLDDSSDETSQLLATQVDELTQRGFDVAHIRRSARDDYKAGALAHGLETAKGDFVAIFDADFVPQRTFLRAAMPSLLADDEVGCVQARWEHINRGHSLLTQVQAVLLDAHFAVEHEARQRSQHFLNFNGTAGVWRRRAIEEAGGWSGDTLTEDLDLSMRAQLAGWRFVYRHDLGAPSELPTETNAFKRQQRRWVRGSLQTTRKLLARVWRSPGIPFATRLEASFHLLNNANYPVALGMLLLALPTAGVATELHPWTMAVDFWLLGFGILPILAYFFIGQMRVGRSPLVALLLLPATLAVGAGIVWNNTRAAVLGLFGGRSEFVRTPKYAVQNLDDTWVGKRYFAGKSFFAIGELVLAVLCGVAALTAAQHGKLPSALLFGIFACGNLQIGLGSLLATTSERLRRGFAILRRSRTASATSSDATAPSKNAIRRSSV